MRKPDTADVEAPARPEIAERRYVYNGEPMTAPTDFAPRTNRPVRRRKRSRFNIVAVLVLVSVTIVLYIWNKITVNQLAIDVNDLQVQYGRILNANEFLRAEINRKSSLDRIGKIATSQLDLVYPKEQPVWFEIDQNQIEALNHTHSEQRGGKETAR